MTTQTAAAGSARKEASYERHAWKVLLGISLIIGLFGVGDMLGGASDLQNGETVMMHSLTGMSWNELRAASPSAANLIEVNFRSDGASLTTIAVLSIAVCLTGFRRGERWAWFALWAIPGWMALIVFFVWRAIQYPGYGTPIPILSGSILSVLWVTLLALSYRKFFRS